MHRKNLHTPDDRRKRPPRPSDFDPEKVAAVERKKDATRRALRAMMRAQRIASGEPLLQLLQDGEEAA